MYISWNVGIFYVPIRGLVIMQQKKKVVNIVKEFHLNSQGGKKKLKIKCGSVTIIALSTTFTNSDLKLAYKYSDALESHPEKDLGPSSGMRKCT